MSVGCFFFHSYATFIFLLRAKQLSFCVIGGWHLWRRSRMAHLPETAFFPLAPDWICEILSPSTASLDRVKKLTSYAHEIELELRSFWADAE